MNGDRYGEDGKVKELRRTGISPGKQLSEDYIVIMFLPSETAAGLG